MLGVGPFLTDPPRYDREQMDTIFSHHGDQKFWKLRACSEDTLPKILPHLVIKVPASHFAPRISQLPPPFNLFMNVQLILIGGGGALRVTCVTLFRSSHSRQFVLNSNRRSKIENRKYIRSRLFTLFHAILRGGGERGALDPGLTQLSTTNPCVQPSENTRQTHGKHTPNTRKKHTKHTAKSRKHKKTHALFFNATVNLWQDATVPCVR